MTEIIVEEDCGNAPRKAWLRDFNVAFINGEVEETIGFVTEDVTWDLVGEGKIEGRAGMKAWLESMAGKSAKKVVLRNIITHGKVAAINGSYEMESGSRFEFCDVYEFAGGASDSPIHNYPSYVFRV